MLSAELSRYRSWNSNELCHQHQRTLREAFGNETESTLELLRENTRVCLLKKYFYHFQIPNLEDSFTISPWKYNK
tara:strand:+ start:95043 stop:95267 length:225 start_codon:yes stop_codon:yes gene_type:complete